jgi:hypothetical protein
LLEGEEIMGLGLLVGYLAQDRRETEERLPAFVRRMPALANAALKYGAPYPEYAQTAKRFKTVNKCLSAAKLQPHNEPSFLSEEQLFSCQMWGYSGIHHLRRLAAYSAQGRTLYVPERKLEETSDVIVKDYYEMAADGANTELPYKHLMQHGDGEGMYIPQDFCRVVAPSKRYFAAVGGRIGSSFQLLKECQALAAIIDLPLNLDIESSEIWDAADEPGKGALKWQQFGIESFSCIRLARACERSIESGAALVFC